jgi:hypothetical protein
VIRRSSPLAGIAAGLLLSWSTAAGPSAAAGPVLVDDFEDVSRWSAHPADGVEMKLSADGAPGAAALRIDFRFARGGGYAVARRAVDLTLPDNYAFSFRIRGEAPSNNFEFKLIDSTGENVWWCNRRNVEFPRRWETFTLKRRQIEFAWGPAGGGTISRVAAIEIAITAGSGGQGTIWLDQLELRPLAPPRDDVAPVARASSSRQGHDAALAADRDSSTFWWTRSGERRPWLELDLGGDREFGGLVLDWVAGRHARHYAIQISPDARTWQAIREVEDGDGGRDLLRLPESEAHYLRLVSLDPPGSRGCALAEFQVMPLAWGATQEAFLRAVASHAPRGAYPRGITGEQAYWTVVGVDGDSQEGLVCEDGAVEVGKQGFSVEPFLFAGDRLWTWNDARAEQSLEDGDLPIPTVRWATAPIDLEVTVFANGERGASSLVARYRVSNRSAHRRTATLFLAIRPYQVNPPSQFLNSPGGASPIQDLWREGRLVRVNRVRGVIALSEPAAFGATTFDAGDVSDFLRRGRLPPRSRVRDPLGSASGALAYDFDLAPGASAEVSLLMPLGRIPSLLPVPVDPAREVEAWRARCAAGWRALLDRVDIELPPSAATVADGLRSQLAYILINRDGAAIQPGSRSYERSWIRDGSLTSSALLRLGHADAAREFIEWFAPYQYESGKVPCCVDSRGADPVPEHDSHGEFIFLVAEYYRYTGDRALVERLWPRVRAAVAYLDSLRQQRRTPEYRAPGRREFFGLLPPSISHEGYSAKPMHSYWDDLFALRGFKDAGFLARTLGLSPEASRWTRVRAEFERDLGNSVRATMARHRIDYVPGCADLGDFDATSTTIALDPVQAQAALPPEALRRTFERYWTFFEDRRAGRAAWEAFTPYELRNVGAFVRLGWRQRANELLDFFLDYRRPPGWEEWAEVVWRDARTPRFIGDMPHTWVGSDFVRSVLDMLAYDRESDDALVVGAGVRETWVREAPGVTVRRLPTRFGRLDVEMRGVGPGIEVRLGGDLRVPAGGVVLAAPGVTSRWSATVNGAVASVSGSGQVVVRTLPATVVLKP